MKYLGGSFSIQVIKVVFLIDLDLASFISPGVTTAKKKSSN
jgi:hypothetical protein